MASCAPTGSPCGACKFLRRKCAADCVFAPYFCSDQGPARFAAIHKVFGASNVAKMLQHVPVADRCDAVVTIAYEAQARVRDPVYGCVAHIFALQQQVAYLQAQLLQLKSQLSQTLIPQSSTTSSETPWPPSPGIINTPHINSSPFHLQYDDILSNSHYSISPQNSIESVHPYHRNHDIINRGDEGIAVAGTQPYTKKRASQMELSELQEMAFKMMKNEN